MFSFPEGPEPISVEDPELGPGARLVIEVPHWTALLTIVDNDLRPATGLSKLVPLEDGREGASATIVLPAGTYNVEAMLGGQTQTTWVVAPEGHETRVPVEVWDRLSLTTSMPLASVIDGTPADDPLVTSAQHMSLAGAAASAPPAPAGPEDDGHASAERDARPRAPANAPPASEARLFLFGRCGPSAAPGPTSWDLQLIDESGAPVAALREQDLRVESDFWSCTVDLPRGYYVLRARELPHATGPRQSLPGAPDKSFFRYQPLYLCAGWESHVFLECDQSPRLATLSFNMARMGAGFRPDDDATIAAAAVLAALGSDNVSETILQSARMEELLRGEMGNPWLMVLAAYALSASPAGTEPSGLLADVTSYLLREMSDHPDVRALTLDPGRMVPLDYPPMLRAGLRLVRAFAGQADSRAIVTDSALARVGQRFAADSAWTAWVEPDETLAGTPPGDAESHGTQPMQALAEVLSSSAAVYPLRPAEAGPGARASRSFAEQVAIIAQAEMVRNAANRDEAPPARVASRGSVVSLLDTSVAEITRFIAAGQETVQEGLKQLSQSLEQLETLDQRSMQAMQSVLAAIFDAKRCANLTETAADGGPGREEGPFVTPIEDQVATLRQEAGRLRSLWIRDEPPSDDELALAESQAVRLDNLADRLIRRAYLVIIADEDGRLLYGNRLLRDRLKDRIDPEDVVKRMQRALKGSSADRFRVPARVLSPTSPEGREGTDVDIHRTYVRDENKRVQAIVYLLKNADAGNVEPEVAQRLDTLLRIITLHAATAQHGDREVLPQLQALGEVIEEVDGLLG